MNAKWKDFRLVEARHGFDLSDFKPGGYKKVLKALGIPPILLDSGNNANIRPNHRLYYLETILPIVRKVNFALERFFGFEIQEDISNIPALQPELRDAASYYSSLVNGGIMTVNEAREALAFALLAWWHTLKYAGNSVPITGTSRPLVLGMRADPA